MGSGFPASEPSECLPRARLSMSRRGVSGRTIPCRMIASSSDSPHGLRVDRPGHALRREQAQARPRTTRLLVLLRHRSAILFLAGDAQSPCSPRRSARRSKSPRIAERISSRWLSRTAGHSRRCERFPLTRRGERRVHDRVAVAEEAGRPRGSRTDVSEARMEQVRAMGMTGAMLSPRHVRSTWPTCLRTSSRRSSSTGSQRLERAAVTEVSHGVCENCTHDATRSLSSAAARPQRGPLAAGRADPGRVPS